MFLGAVCHQDRSGAAENLMGEIVQLRSIASKRHRLGLESRKGLETGRSVSSECLHGHCLLPLRHILCHDIRTILHTRPAETELSLRSCHVLHHIADHLVRLECGTEIDPAGQRVAEDVLRIVAHELAHIECGLAEKFILREPYAAQRVHEIIEEFHCADSVFRVTGVECLALESDLEGLSSLCR